MRSYIRHLVVESWFKLHSSPLLAIKYLGTIQFIRAHPHSRFEFEKDESNKGGK